MLLVPLSQVHKNRLLVAALAAVGASLIAANPMSPNTDLAGGQHRAVTLTAGEETWSEVVAAAETNLQTLETEATGANTALSTVINADLTHYGSQITSALTGFETGIQNAIDGGWYGSDDGYVEGLFPGVITTGPDAPYTSIGTLAEISNALQAGQTEQAFSYVDTYFLETLDHTLQPLLSPLLGETSGHTPDAITTTLSIPVELSQLQTNLLEQFGSYAELKALGDSTLAPLLSVGFGLSTDVQTIATDFSTGDYTQGLTDLSNLSSDITGDLLNGWEASVSGEAFTGLLNSGSILEDLLVTWPDQLATALTESFTTVTPAVAADLATGLF